VKKLEKEMKELGNCYRASVVPVVDLRVTLNKMKYELDRLKIKNTSQRSHISILR